MPHWARSWCVADCDVDAANLYLLFNPAHEKNRSLYQAVIRLSVDHSLCTVCGICESYCRFDAIREKEGKMVISETSCDGCFFCSRICPMGAITMVRSDKSRMYSGRFRNGMMVYGRLAPGEENSGKLGEPGQGRGKASLGREGT
ncbi:MAG: 4Fe-4S binding protein [Marinilabiliales bacterium]|nr:4Fe-4S binding protein [Marinilabiliales bacterium]